MIVYAASKPSYVNFIPFQCQHIVDLVIPSLLGGHIVSAGSNSDQTSCDAFYA